MKIEKFLLDVQKKLLDDSKFDNFTVIALIHLFNKHLSKEQQSRYEISIRMITEYNTTEFDEVLLNDW